MAPSAPARPSVRPFRLPRAGVPGWAWLLVALALLAGLGLRDPSPADEPRFALAARTMVETGEWLIPRRGSELYAHKPPPFMWLQAAALWLTGSLRVAFLLPSLLAALGTLWLVRDLGARLWSRRHGDIAALALFAVLQFGLQAKRAQIDMLLVFWTTLAMWGLLRHLLQGPDWRALALGGLAAGIGTVTKGVGFLPLLVLLPWAWLRWRGALPALAPPGGGWRWWALPLAFLAGVGAWLGPMLATVLASDDPALHAYAEGLLFKQTATRYANAWHHVQPAWYYLEVMATLWLPGALLLPWLLPAWWRRLTRGDAPTTLLLGWVVLVLAFFSASAGKREVYIFPALPMLALAAAPLLGGLLARTGVQRALRGWLVLMAVLALAIAIGGSLEARAVMRAATERGLSAGELAWLLGALYAVGLGALVLLAWAWRRRAGGRAAVGFAALLWIAYGLGIAPALDASSSGRRLMAQAREAIGPDATLGLVAWSEQHLLQARGPVAEFGFERPKPEQWDAAAAWAGEGGDGAPRWLFADAAYVPACVDATQRVALGRANRRDWVLVRPHAGLAGCRSPAGASRAPSEDAAD